MLYRRMALRTKVTKGSISEPDGFINHQAITRDSSDSFRCYYLQDSKDLFDPKDPKVH